MTTYILQSLNPSERPAPDTLSSIVLDIPFPDRARRQFFERYKALRTERNTEEETHYNEDSGKLALEVYNQDPMRAEREEWTVLVTSTFREIVEANKNTLRHVELILPTGGVAAPLMCLDIAKEIVHLESFCVQWALRGYLPMTVLLMSQWAQILEDSIVPSFARFHADLMDLLATHAKSLKRLRISLPQSTSRKPFSALSINVASFPSLPVLEILDLTHWSPSISDIKALLTPDGPVPNLQHLIVDHGTPLPLTDFEVDCEGLVGPDYDPNMPEIEAHSWPALGAHIALHKPPLRSLSAALHDVLVMFGFANRLDQTELRETLADGAGDASLDGLVLCTAWPIRYEAQEPGGAEAEKKEEDLYAHAPGCGHLAYPSDQRPTTGLWPAATSETRATQILAGYPWY